MTVAAITPLYSKQKGKTMTLTDYNNHAENGNRGYEYDPAQEDKKEQDIRDELECCYCASCGMCLHSWTEDASEITAFCPPCAKPAKQEDSDCRTRPGNCEGITKVAICENQT